MTTSTTDAEAIARIIDPNAFRGAFLSTQPSRSKDRARAKAAAILSYLASRQGVQEPVDITWQDVRLHAGEGALSTADVLKAVNAHLRRLHRYTAPPAPAGEVERSALEPVLSFLDELAANGQSGQRKALNPVLIGGSAKLYAEGLRAALNGGRE